MTELLPSPNGPSVSRMNACIAIAIQMPAMRAGGSSSKTPIRISIHGTR